MTGRTHDLAAFTFLNYVLVTSSITTPSLGTVLVSVFSCMIGGLAPDLDQPTANLWRKLPAGTFLGSLLSPLFGGHRFISHSIVGLALAGVISNLALNFLSTFVIVNMDYVWNAFMIGYFSHLFFDSLTIEGVPWFFPIPVKLGFPPIKALRIKTGGLLEKYLVFPGLLLFNLYLFSQNYEKVVNFVKSLF